MADNVSIILCIPTCNHCDCLSSAMYRSKFLFVCSHSLKKKRKKFKNNNNKNCKILAMQHIFCRTTLKCNISDNRLTLFCAGSLCPSSHTHYSVKKIVFRPVAVLGRCVVSVFGSSCSLCPAARSAPAAVSLCPPRRLSSVPGSALDSCPAPACCGPPAQTDAWTPGAPLSVHQWRLSEHIQDAFSSIIVFKLSQDPPHKL